MEIANFVVFSSLALDLIWHFDQGSYSPSCCILLFSSLVGDAIFFEKTENTVPISRDRNLI